MDMINYTSNILVTTITGFVITHTMFYLSVPAIFFVCQLMEVQCILRSTNSSPRYILPNLGKNTEQGRNRWPISLIHNTAGNN